MDSVYKEKRWAIANQEKENGVFEEFLYKDSLGCVYYPFIKKVAGQLNGITYYDIASYRGAQGPYPIPVEHMDVRELMVHFLKAFEEYCEKEHIIAEFAKLDPWVSHHDDVIAVTAAQYYGNFYCIDLTRDFYNELFNRRAKRCIRKAEGAGITVEFDHKGNSTGRFIELYRNTEEKYMTSEYYKMSENDIKKIFEQFGEDAFLCNAILDGRIITSVLTVMGKDIAHYLLLGSDSQYVSLQANSLLTYQTALYAKEKGKLLLDMGGGVPGGGVEQFKRNFISQDGVFPYYAIKRIHNISVYNQLVEQKEYITNPKFFPLYRG